MKILALDLGSCTGFAWNSGAGPNIGSHTWATDKELRDMRARRLDRRGDIRVVRFFDWLTDLHKMHQFDAIVFEDVQFHTSTAQTQLWSSFRTTVWLAFPRTLIEAVPVGTLKKFATGSGAADKNAMGTALFHEAVRRIEAYGEFLPGVKHLDPDILKQDDAVDATWLWLWAQQNLARTKL